MKRLSSLFVVLPALVALSGCGLFAESDPAPPGVEGNKLFDKTALFEAHQNGILADGAVIRVRHHSDDPDLLNLTRVIYVEPNAQAYLSVTQRPNGTNLTKIWGNGSTAWVRNLNSGSLRNVSNSRAHTTEGVTALRMLRSWLGPTEPIYANQTVQRHGRTLWILTGQRETPAGTPTIRFHLAVDRDGLIWSGRYTAPVQSENHTRTYVYNLTRVGNVSVRTPEWVGANSSSRGSR